MNIISDNEHFKVLTKKTSNPYNSITYLATKARQLAKEYDEHILHSEALTHVINGTKPELNEACKYNEITDVLADVLELIDDEDILNSVYESVQESLNSNSLIYIYEVPENDIREPRIRILVNIVLDKYYNR